MQLQVFTDSFTAQGSLGTYGPNSRTSGQENARVRVGQRERGQTNGTQALMPVRHSAASGGNPVNVVSAPSGPLPWR
jgi:hypothetical protein